MGAFYFKIENRRDSGVATGRGLVIKNPSFVTNVTSYLVTFIRILQICITFILFSMFILLFKCF